MGREEFINLWWGSCYSNAISTQGDTLYIDWICTIKSGEKVGVLVWHNRPPIHLLIPESTTSPSQHVRFT